MRVVRGLLYAMMDRGSQSSGMAFVDKNDAGVREITVIKDAKDAFTFVNDHWDALKKHEKSTVVLGHTRQATTGSVCAANAHPFTEIGRDGVSLVGIHNGMISNWKTLDQKCDVADGKGGLDRGVDSDVDSQAFFRHLARRADKSIAKTLEEARGYFAFAWYDERDGRMHLAASGGPIHVAKVNDGSIYWASEWPPLAAACTAAGLSFQLIEFKDGEHWAIDVDTKAIEELRFTPVARYGDYNLGPGAYANGGSMSKWDDGYPDTFADKWSGYGCEENDYRTNKGKPAEDKTLAEKGFADLDTHRTGKQARCDYCWEEPEFLGLDGLQLDKECLWLELRSLEEANNTVGLVETWCLNYNEIGEDITEKGYPFAAHVLQLIENRRAIIDHQVEEDLKVEAATAAVQDEIKKLAAGPDVGLTGSPEHI